MNNSKKIVLVVGILAAVTALGCVQPPEAPTELGELSLYLFGEFDAEDEVIAEGVVNLEALLADLDCWEDFEQGQSRDGREWTVPVLVSGDLGGVSAPAGADPEGQIRVSVAALSEHSVDEHASLVPMPDQAPAQTDSSVVYDREFLTDVDCFVDHSCDGVETFNVIRREMLILEVEYESYKDFRWVEMPDGSGTAMIARSWVEDRFVGVENEGQALEQNYSAELWLPRPEGSLLFLANWVQWTIPGIDDDNLITSLTASGVDEIFEAYEAYLDGGDGS